VVLQAPDHTPFEAPKFTIYVLDAAGVVVDPVYGIYEVTASDALSGFNTSTPDPGVYDPYSNVAWKDWTTVVIDLSPYIGQNITVRFTTYDCTFGGHFGYAYIACSCGNTTSINEINNKENNITAFPNPSNGNFTLQFAGNGNEITEFTVFNILNKEVYSGKLKTTAGTNHAHIDLSGLSDGVYMIRIKIDENLYSEKIIKQ